MRMGKNTLRLTESKLKNIINESVKKAINEINLDTSIRAEEASEYWSQQLKYEFKEFKDAASGMYEILINREYPHEHFNKEKWITSQTQGDKLASELDNVVRKIESFVNRKEKQYYDFAANTDDKYKERFGATDTEMGRRMDTYAEKYGWDTLDEPEWRKENLTPQENDYWDYKTKRNEL